MSLFILEDILIKPDEFDSRKTSNKKSKRESCNQPHITTYIYQIDDLKTPNTVTVHTHATVGQLY